MTDLCRRTILLAPLGYLAACSATRWYRAKPGADGIVHVPLSELEPAGFVQVELGSNGFLLHRDAAGALAAVTLTCTHQGCGISKRRDELVCPCHGSRFDLQGAVLNGPATEPLPRYEVEVAGDTALVHVGNA